MMFFILVLGYNILFYLGEYCSANAENHLLSAAFLLVFLTIVIQFIRRTGALTWSFDRKSEKELPFTAWIIPGLFGLWSIVQTVKSLYYGAEVYPIDTVIGTLLLVTAAAVYEELLFRGFIFEYLLPHGYSCALWGADILFAAAHMFNSQFGSFCYDFVIQILIALCFGYFFSVFVFMTKSLFPAICMHIWINAVSPYNYLQEAPRFDEYDLLVYVVLAVICLYYSNRIYRQQKEGMVRIIR